MREDDGTEATSGDHGEAAITTVDLMMLWGVLVLLAVTLANLKLAGWMPLPWVLIWAPAWAPLVVLLVVLLVAMSGDLITARARRA